MEQYLKPCPFCGSTDVIVTKCHAPHVLKKYHGGYIAGCLNCKITTAIQPVRKTRSPLFNSVNQEKAKQNAIDLWNDRFEE